MEVRLCIYHFVVLPPVFELKIYKRFRGNGLFTTKNEMKKMCATVLLHSRVVDEFSCYTSHREYQKGFYLLSNNTHHTTLNLLLTSTATFAFNLGSKKCCNKNEKR